MRFAHVSDLHLLPPDSVEGAPRPTAEDVATAIAEDLAAISDALDLVVVSGDLTDRADTASFATFERIFSRVGVPIAVIPGNHDGPSGMRAHVRQSSRLARWDISNRVLEIGGVRFLGLDTCVENLTQGAIDAEAIALVAEEIARDSHSPLVVVMHHPPLVLGLDMFDGFCEIERGAELRRLLTTADREIVALSGHVHRPYSAREGSLSCFVAGSMVAPYDSARPFGTDPIRPAALQDFYFIHDIGRKGRHVVTPQRVRGLVSHGAVRRDPAMTGTV